MTVIAAL